MFFLTETAVMFRGNGRPVEKKIRSQQDCNSGWASISGTLATRVPLSLGMNHHTEPVLHPWILLSLLKLVWLVLRFIGVRWEVFPIWRDRTLSLPPPPHSASFFSLWIRFRLPYEESAMRKRMRKAFKEKSNLREKSVIDPIIRKARSSPSFEWAWPYTTG